MGIIGKFYAHQEIATDEGFRALLLQYSSFSSGYVKML